MRKPSKNIYILGVNSLAVCKMTNRLVFSFKQVLTPAGKCCCCCPTNDLELNQVIQTDTGFKNTLLEDKEELSDYLKTRTNQTSIIYQQPEWTRSFINKNLKLPEKKKKLLKFHLNRWQFG